MTRCVGLSCGRAGLVVAKLFALTGSSLLHSLSACPLPAGHGLSLLQEAFSALLTSPAFYSWLQTSLPSRTDVTLLPWLQ